MAAQQGTLTLIGKSGRTYSIDVHFPDAAGTICCFNATGNAASTSPTTFRVPEPCIIVDISIAASPTATSAVFQVNSGSINGGAIRYANQLDSLVNRQKLSIPVNAGDFVGLNQYT